MKQERKEELRTMKPAVLNARLREISKELLQFKMALKAGNERNVRQGKLLRYERAFIKTLLRQQQTAAAIAQDLKKGE